MSAFQRKNGRWSAKLVRRGEQVWIPGGPWESKADALRAEDEYRKQHEIHAPLSDGPHTVYLLWDGDELLYVGVTGCRISRLEAHGAGKPWWSRVTRATFEHLESGPEARKREAHLIAELRPKHNQVHNPDRGQA
jgi:predicted GIY-YIG superfamily endonuclease